MIKLINWSSIEFSLIVQRYVFERVAMVNMKLPQILPDVTKPARYTNGELNACRKNWDDVQVKMVLAFPDLYEIGMGNLGFKILYHIINQRTDCLAERAYMPWIDMQKKMKEESLMLTALESGQPLSDFDIIGFTLQYELSYSNIVKMLDLANIPRFSRERQEAAPLIIAGGPLAFNPEPIADFLDCIVLGDGEEVIHEVLDIIKDSKQERSAKDDILTKLSKVSGVYIPSFYRIEYYSTGEIQDIKPKFDYAAMPVLKRVVADLDQTEFPDKFVVPYLKIVHDRAVIEVMRGCTRGCRFCQAGMIYRPVRERSVDTLLSQAENLLNSTGYEDISLASLSTGDYTCVEKLVKELMKQHHGEGVSVSLPSLRVDTFSVNLAKEIQKFKKTGLTFAPEAGTQRLRDVINKNVKEADLYKAVRGAFAAGWHQIKLYFMIGLPTETKEDIDGIIVLAQNVLDIGKEYWRKGQKKPTVNVSISSFVPKSHTPFQWEAQERQDVLLEKQAYLRKRLRIPGITFRFHDVRLSYLEAIFARGDRRLSTALARAVDLGCQFDGWSECFSFNAWMEAFQEVGIDGDFYAYRVRKPDEFFPWEHLSCGVDRSFLLEERSKAVNEITTDDCRFSQCNNCAVCSDLSVCNCLQKGNNDET